MDSFGNRAADRVPNGGGTDVWVGVPDWSQEGGGGVALRAPGELPRAEGVATGKRGALGAMDEFGAARGSEADGRDGATDGAVAGRALYAVALGQPAV